MHCFERQDGYLNDATGEICREFSFHDVEATRAAREAYVSR